MNAGEELFDEIWVSSNFTTVFCTEEETQNHLNFLRSGKEIPKGMSIVLTKKKLNRQYNKSEIMNATPEQLKMMIA